ncbi:MAG: GNAT family N-acetyltransferase [Burkholderiaceae bacterium]
MKDADLLSVLATQVWLHTYATNGVTGEMARYLLSEHSPARYLALLRERSACIIVAEGDGGVIGFAVVKFGVQCSTGAKSAAELQTLYVQEHFIGRGIGKALLQASESRAREQSNSALWLTVNVENARAIAFYAHMGYSRIGTTHFILGGERHENHVLIGGDA